MDRERLEREEGERRRRVMMMYGLVGVAILVFAGILAYSAGKRKRVEGERFSQAPVAAPAQPAARSEPAVPLPSTPDEIKALLSNPTNPVVRITTGKGDMLAELFEDKVPNTVANMVQLAEQGFYKGMSFHRLIPDFMAQGGCPNSKQGAEGMPGTGGPGYQFGDEFHKDLKHTGPGILSMANSGPGTNGSQFFLCFTATPHLNGKHSVFGKVVAGLDVLDKLEKISTPSGKPKETVRFNIEVVLKQDHPYEVKKL